MADYFGLGRRRGSSSAGQSLNPGPAQTPAGTGAPSGPSPRPLRPMPSRDSMRQPSSIRIRRLPSSQLGGDSRPQSQRLEEDEGVESHDAAVAGRRRSSSAPQRYGSNQTPQQQFEENRLSRHMTAGENPHMGTITEGQQMGPGPQREAVETPGYDTPSTNLATPASEAPAERLGSGAPVMAQAADAARENRGLKRFRTNTGPSRRDQAGRDEYQADVVGLLDLLDPEVRTLGTLTNVQNSLFVPDLGGLLNRRPTYELTPRPTDVEQRPRTRASTRASARPPPPRQMTTMKEGQATGGDQGDIELQVPQRKTSISSQLSDSHYAVLPHGVDLEGWTEEDIDELNDHVRHLLHSRREGFKRSMRGFGKYISKPLGLFVFVYATLVTLFGAAWVFCLIGWIYVGSEQDYFINVIDLVLVALFALIGDGLAPFRAVDTYHMCFIAHYHHLTWRLRREQNLPNLVNHNDLPDRRINVEEAADIVDKEQTAEFSVLSPLQQRRLQYHQAKFSKAHTFYKPHETATHHAFPLRLMIASVVLLDCHSLLQVALGTCTWSIDYRVRPEALTATILSCSIFCNILAGVMISIGDHRTRKKDVLERLFRQGLTEEAIRRMQKDQQRAEEAEEAANGDAAGGGGGSDGAPRKSFGGRKSLDAKRKSMDKTRKSLDAKRRPEHSHAHHAHHKAKVSGDQGTREEGLLPRRNEGESRAVAASSGLELDKEASVGPSWARPQHPPPSSSSPLPPQVGSRTYSGT